MAYTCHVSTEFCEHRLINVCVILLTNKQSNAGANITSLADVSNHANSSKNIISSNHANGTRSKANSLHKGLSQKQLSMQHERNRLHNVTINQIILCCEWLHNYQLHIMIKNQLLIEIKITKINKHFNGYGNLFQHFETQILILLDLRIILL